MAEPTDRERSIARIRLVFTRLEELAGSAVCILQVFNAYFDLKLSGYAI